MPRVEGGGGGGEEDKQAEVGTGSPRAAQGLLKLVDRGRNFFYRRKEGHDTNAKPFRRRGGRISPWHKCFLNVFLETHLVFGWRTLASDVWGSVSRMRTGESRELTSR